MPKASAQFPTTEFLMTPTRNASLSLATPEATPVNKNSRLPLPPLGAREGAARRLQFYHATVAICILGQVSTDRPRSARLMVSRAREGPCFCPVGPCTERRGRCSLTWYSRRWCCSEDLRMQPQSADGPKRSCDFPLTRGQ